MSVVHEGHDFINFRNRTYQWVDVLRFRISDEDDVLAAVLGHELFGCSHAVGEIGGDPERHGPYWRKLITPDSYRRVDAEDAVRRLRVWAEQYARVSDAVWMRLETEIYQRSGTADEVHELHGPGEESYHD
ncbi:MAG TPA: hypothetical protein VN408_24355 [Actinoplanes sp.]|nr:hypothetical protein [Actinoplanes sp.]